MVKGKILEEYVLVEVSEIVVEDGDPNPWGSGHKIDQGGNVSSLSNRDGKLWVKECCMRKAAIKEEQLVSGYQRTRMFKKTDHYTIKRLKPEHCRIRSISFFPRTGGSDGKLRWPINQNSTM